MRKLRILHCANFSEFKDGQSFYSPDRKISFGFASNGHLVYDFGYRDKARAVRFLGFKKKSLEKMNKSLINTVKNFQPDLLVLGKCEYVTFETLKEIKTLNPDLKIIQWFVDHLEREKVEFFKKLELIDWFFQSSDYSFDELSKQYTNTKFGYLPYIADDNFETPLDLEKEYDLIYIARDHKEDIRYKFAQRLDEFCKKENINLKMYGSLGNPLVFGQNFYEEVSKSKIAINFNRTDFLEKVNPNVYLAASDRMFQFMGVGTCTFSPKINGFESFFKDNEELVYFENIEECFKKIKEVLTSNNFIKIGENGEKKIKTLANSKKVTAYMIETAFNQNYTYDYEWKDLKINCNNKEKK